MIPALSLLATSPTLTPQPATGGGAGFARTLIALEGVPATPDALRQESAAPGNPPPSAVEPEVDPLAWLDVAPEGESPAPDDEAAEVHPRSSPDMVDVPVEPSTSETAPVPVAASADEAADPVSIRPDLAGVVQTPLAAVQPVALTHTRMPDEQVGDRDQALEEPSTPAPSFWTRPSPPPLARQAERASTRVVPVRDGQLEQAGGHGRPAELGVPVRKAEASLDLEKPHSIPADPVDARVSFKHEEAACGPEAPALAPLAQPTAQPVPTAPPIRPPETPSAVARIEPARPYARAEAVAPATPRSAAHRPSPLDVESTGSESGGPDAVDRFPTRPAEATPTVPPDADAARTGADRPIGSRPDPSATAASTIPPARLRRVGEVPVPLAPNMTAQLGATSSPGIEHPSIKGRPSIDAASASPRAAQNPAALAGSRVAAVPPIAVAAPVAADAPAPAAVPATGPVAAEPAAQPSPVVSALRPESSAAPAPAPSSTTPASIPATEAPPPAEPPAARDTGSARDSSARPTLQPAPAFQPTQRPIVSGPAAQVFAAELRRGARDARPAPTGAEAVLPMLAPASSAATAATTPAPAIDVRHEQWPTAMVERIERLRDDVAAADTRVRLVPDALGAVEVRVRREGDAVHVHFAAEQAATRQMLQDAAPRLAEAAEARGLKLGQMGVGGGSGGGGQADANGGRRESAPAAPPTPPRARRDAPAEDVTDTRIA